MGISIDGERERNHSKADPLMSASAEAERSSMEHLKGTGYDSIPVVALYSTGVDSPFSSKAGEMLNAWRTEAT